MATVAAADAAYTMLDDPFNAQSFPEITRATLQ
jgi:hypothetical protein